MWNPSTGFFYVLPEPVGWTCSSLILDCYGFGYLSASDDYKLIAKFVIVSDDGGGEKMLVFSTKANIWTITEAHLDYFFHGKWALSNEALHWLDLANEEFRRMPLPIVYGELMHQAFGDSVCVFDFGNVDTAGSIDLWVMKNFGVADSWAKLFNLKVTNQHEKIVWLCPILVLEAATFLEKKTIESDVLKLISSSHTKEELETHVCSGDVNLIDLIQYEETLLWPASP